MARVYVDVVPQSGLAQSTDNELTKTLNIVTASSTLRLVQENPETSGACNVSSPTLAMTGRNLFRNPMHRTRSADEPRSILAVVHAPTVFRNNELPGNNLIDT